jgi:hypothetical protein
MFPMFGCEARCPRERPGIVLKATGRFFGAFSDPSSARPDIPQICMQDLRHHMNLAVINLDSLAECRGILELTSA